jgi:NADPH-dependent 2,4-dienoyl-CoA reductase/sulfur reductase-like enzyme
LYERLRQLQPQLPLTRDLFNSFDDKIRHSDYSGTPCKDKQVLIVGAGPGGLRSAIEMALLGATVVVLEQREQFARNNVLILMVELIND